MTTIIVKNADFSGAPLAGYVPPVPGATLAAFVGDPDPDIALRNFGSGADLVLAASMPQDAGGGFRTFSSTNHMISDAHYASETTLMAVMKGQPTEWMAALSSERTLSGSNRRGLTLRMKKAESRVTIAAAGDSGVQRESDLVVPSLTIPRCAIGTAAPSGTGGTQVQIHDMTLGQSGPVVTGTAPSTRPTADEASWPFLIGANYVGTAIQGDIAFVAVWPFALSSAQRALMYQSVKKRMAALGSAI